MMASEISMHPPPNVQPLLISSEPFSWRALRTLSWWTRLAPCLLSLLVAFGSVFPGQAAAEDPPAATRSSEVDLRQLSLEELLNVKVDTVYGASKFEQKTTRAPASISIVTSDEIKQFGHRTLADVLNSVRGVYFANDRNYRYLGVRGFLRPGDYNSRVLILIDGHPTNDAVYDGGYIGYEGMVDVDLIERVEFIRGPSSSIYGSSAFFGVVNVVTKRGDRFDGPELSLDTGRYGTHTGRLTYGHYFENGVNLLLSTTYYTSDGDDLYFPEFDENRSADPRARNRGWAEGLDGEKAFQLFGSLNYKDLTITAFYSTRGKEVPTASFGTLFNDGRAETRDRHFFVDVKYDHTFDSEVRLLARAYYDRVSYHGRYPYDYADAGDPPLDVLFKDYALGDRIGTEIQISRMIFDKHTLLGGLEYRENLHQEQINYDDTEPPFYYLADDRSSRTFGLFAQGEFQLHEKWLLNAGARLDYYPDSFGSTASPRLGLIYSPADQTTFKLLYGQAFRAPSAYERFYILGQEEFAALEPERIRTLELAVDQKLSETHQAHLSFFRYEITNLISQTNTSSAGDLYFRNDEETVAHGAEAELRAVYASGVKSRLSYSIQRAEDGGGQQLSNSPCHLAKLGLIVPIIPEKLSAGLEVQYLGSVESVRGLEIDDSVIANLALLSGTFWKNMEASASIYNVFNSRYHHAGSGDHLQDAIRQDGRTFRVKVTYRF
jgi:outer membrane receptor for ferrienterochelin and colicins